MEVARRKGRRGGGDRGPCVRDQTNTAALHPPRPVSDCSSDTTSEIEQPTFPTQIKGVVGCDEAGKFRERHLCTLCCTPKTFTRLSDLGAHTHPPRSHPNRGKACREREEELSAAGSQKRIKLAAVFGKIDGAAEYLDGLDAMEPPDRFQALPVETVQFFWNELSSWHKSHKGTDDDADCSAE